MNIDTSTAENFYNSYHQYFIDNIKPINIKSDKTYKYIFYCIENEDIYCIEGSSMNEIYYKILFKIGYNCCNEIFANIGSKYQLDVLNDPIQLLKSHYFETNNYIFKEIKFLQSDLDEIKIVPNIKVKINKNTADEFYESYKLYYQSKILSKNISNNISKNISTKYQYIFICNEFVDIYFIEGYSIEELYYIVFFKIDSKCWDNIYDSNYSTKELKKPFELFKKHYLQTDEYIFTPIKFI